MRDVLIGTTDYTVLVKINAVAGSPLTGLAYTDIDIAYARVETDNDVTTADVSPATLASLTAAHSDWGFIEVSSTDHPGLYRLDIADAVFATGAWESVVTITDASGTDFYATDIGFRLVEFNPLDGVRLGLTALPNAAADAAGGLPISDAGGLDLDAKVGALTYTVANKVDANVIRVAGTVQTACDLYTEINTVATDTVNAIVAEFGDFPTAAEIATAVYAVLYGTGSDQVTVQVLVSGVGVQGAETWITTDLAGDNRVAGPAFTDSNGEVTFLLTAGNSYYLWSRKDGMDPIIGGDAVNPFVAVAD